jgi:spore coat protein U-like protein
MMRVLCILGAMVLFITNPASACTAKLIHGYNPPPIELDVYNSNQPIISDTIPIDVNASAAACSFGLVFESDQTASGNKRRLESDDATLFYYIEDAGGRVLRSTDDPTSTALLRFDTPLKFTGQQRVPYRIHLDTAKDIREGMYTSRVRVFLYNLGGKTPEYLDDSEFTLTTQIPSSMLIGYNSLSAGTDRVIMDFGDLTSNEQQTATIMVRANRDFSMRLTSQNGGILRLKEGGGAAPAGADTIPYTLLLNGQKATLSSGQITVINNGRATGANGRAYPLSVTIGEVTQKLAGEYQDTLTLTVEGR